MRLPAALTCAFLLHIAGIATAAEPVTGGGDYAHHLAELINHYREQKGLRPLQLTDQLSALAAEHSAYMAKRNQLSHDGFQRRFDRANSTGCVENVGWNYEKPEDQLQGWKTSSGHNQNLLDAKAVRMGIAVAQNYVTFFACR